MRWIVWVALVGCGTTDTGDTDVDTDTDTALVAGLSLTEGGSTILIDDSWRSCEQASDCVIVDISCDGCCGQDAVAADRQSEWGDAFTTMCADYEGGVCDCEFLPVTAECNDSVCEVVPDE